MEGTEIRYKNPGLASVLKSGPTDSLGKTLASVIF